MPSYLIYYKKRIEDDKIDSGWLKWTLCPWKRQLIDIFYREEVTYSVFPSKDLPEDMNKFFKTRIGLLKNVEERRTAKIFMEYKLKKKRITSFREN